jgi:hypothetical protein
VPHISQKTSEIWGTHAYMGRRRPAKPSKASA